jgi:hypothetical protein
LKVRNEIACNTFAEALKWHRTSSKIHRNWYEYATAMQKFLNRGRSDHEIEAEFEHSNYNHKENEEFINYVIRIQILANRLTVPLTQEKLYERVKRGLHPDYLVRKITAKAKCVEYEATKIAKNLDNAFDPFGWFKDRNMQMMTQLMTQKLK